ncbi:hypothetical protein KP509_38G066600 [Ceratopteris richardii]|uniref:Uncharacterized protein n=1 Tax=Ceratopteris richardii TaxID=49495 RepID=A0A8T2Q5V4_CERRI|nr:hypothetical protein KP509_38G066600 [Ceratopteris richardii]
MIYHVPRSVYSEFASRRASARCLEAAKFQHWPWRSQSRCPPHQKKV